ncbi:MAG: DUF2510 domain-containing protein [Acidimicrobiales bacterium]
MTDVRPPEYPSAPPLPYQSGGGAPPVREAGWHADPLGRHQFRYWDGANWSDHVADAGVTSWDPVAPPVGPVPPAYGYIGQPARPVRVRRSRKKLWLALGLVVVVVAAAVGVFSFLVSRVDGAGTFARELEVGGSTLVHTVRAQDDTVILIRVAPDAGGFDPVVGVSADEATIDRYAEFFGTEGPLADDEFAGVVPEGTQLLAVSDAADAGADEVTFVATPLGGEFEVLVSGAGGSVGAFELDITIQEFAGPDDGVAYLEELAQQDFVQDFEPPRSPIEDILDDFIDD